MLLNVTDLGNLTCCGSREGYVRQKEGMNYVLIQCFNVNCTFKLVRLISIEVQRYGTEKMRAGILSIWETSVTLSYLCERGH